MTYADFITLMLIFFVMLYTLTPGVQKDKFEAIVGVFQKNRGVLEYRSVAKERNPVSADIERAKSWEELQQYIDDQGLSEQVQLDLMQDGIRITLGEAVTFDTYSAELKKAAKELLVKVGDNIRDYTAEDLKLIEIGGHTDNKPIRSNATRYRSNWELGSARATTVLNYLVDNINVSPHYFKASTYGEYRPRVPNDSETARRKNRRVEIHVKYQQDGQADFDPLSGQKIKSMKYEN